MITTTEDDLRVSGKHYGSSPALVSTSWVAQHASDGDVRVVEVDVDTSAYEHGHVPGAIAWNWTTQLCEQVWSATSSAPRPSRRY